jgi:NADPH-dependent 2,4-dienoyl-CoA reductase/sulfur reductase-like enzyme/rhodanese-related sulfurtransferase
MTDGKRVLIVGGVAGGASTAARIRRLSEDAQIVLFERGEHISFANCGLPYHIGNVIRERDRLLVQTPERMSKRFRIDVRTRSEVLRIDREKRSVTVQDLAGGKEYAEPYDALVLSPGAEPIRPNIPGIDAQRVFTLRSMTDMDAIKKVVDEEHPTRAVVVGGGYIGLEMTEALAERGLQVCLVELESQVMGTVDAEMAFPLHQELDAHGVELLVNTGVTEIRETAGKGLEVRLSDGGARQADLVLLSVGVRPEVNLAREARLTIGSRGGIVVNERMQTSDPNIYAVGDAVEVVDFVGGTPALIPLAGPANRQGRITADNICGRHSAYHHTQGTAICKVFDLAVAVTGLNEKALKRAGRRYEKVYVHPAHHAGYYPGASQMSLKLLFDPQDGKILGAQAVGVSGVDKRIDVLAVAMRAGMTVRDLRDVELCYAPPFGSAKDPVNYAGFVASNVMAGDMRICHVEDVAEPGDHKLLLDVRSPREFKAGTIPGAVNVPLDTLRDHLDELPRDTKLLVLCQVGLRGYLACRILNQAGFSCRNLTGGYKTYCAVQGIGARAASPARDLKNDTGEKSSGSFGQ